MNQKILLQRKKPHNTWSNSTCSYYLKTQQYISPIEDRINLYEHKYKICMQSRTELSNWIKSNKEKGLPVALTEGYIPPSRTKISSPSSHPTRPTAISSLSTFLKKATSYNNKTQRFSLTSSLNRFSLPKNSLNNLTEKYNIEEQRRLEINISTSTTIPYSSSIFLDKLRPSQETEIEEFTPPSSPSSTGSVYIPPPVKKKRASLLITPSLSTIRLISQKSHFLKRQSMLA